MKERAFTLVELLVVIAILAVLAGLLLPVLARSKREGGMAQSTGQLHQLALAAAIYAEDAGAWPITLYQDVRPLNPYVKDVRLWACPLDPYPQTANEQATRNSGFRVSYYAPLLFEPHYREEWLTRDNQGVLAALHVGTPRAYVSGPAIYDFSGIYLLARRDGSVKRQAYVMRCTSEAPNDPVANWWNLFLPEGPDPSKKVQIEMMATTFAPCQ